MFTWRRIHDRPSANGLHPSASFARRLGRPSRIRWQDLVVVTVCTLTTLFIPLSNQLLSPSSAIHVPDHLVTLAGKLTAYAIVALAMDLVWGYGNILSLCHGLFFALGGYAMGMYLMRSIGTEGVYASALPDFMVFLDWKELPWYWRGFDTFPFAVAMAVLVPSALAFVFGWFSFRSRIRGVYFSVMTQALTYAAMLLFFRNATGFGGNNGLTDFKRILGWSLREPSTRAVLCATTGIALALSYAICRAVVSSRAGRVLTAIRDVEPKVRFSGYNPVSYKLFAWTLSAALCGVAGALYVPQVGIINPSEMQPSNSIEVAIWVAVGGRGTLGGPILGAYAVNGLKSWLTLAFPTAWLFALGTLYIVVTLVFPGGLVDALGRMARFARSARAWAERRPAIPREAPIEREESSQ
ncbi:MAG TPA: urea ABC transporter permease subunit UrtC [Labilithrix sp.]|nr:urea ABC transporter permease subunit UrtC [Labilithrix sp.]